MKRYRLTLKIKSAFGTPLVGDTLFGQLCWEIRHQFGEARLKTLLQGYTEQQPFLVVSDAMPSGYLPLPTLPSAYWEKDNNVDRKVLKKKQWIALNDYAQQAVEKWQKFAKAETELLKKTQAPQMHNTLNRQTNSTGEGMFAPYAMPQIWYTPESELDLYCVLDETRFQLEELQCVLKNMGLIGFGRDASIGLGRFEITHCEAAMPTFLSQHNAYFTLANCAPQGNALDKRYCFYQLTTRFGRHGGLVALSDNPFKKPIILSKIGAVFTPKQFTPALFWGNGLGDISYSSLNAVHQGYAIVMPMVLNIQKLG